MPCPQCESENMTLYDLETYECKDCGHLTHRSKYTHQKSHKGKCKIVGCEHTKDIYGTNRGMVALVGNNRIYNYVTEYIKDNRDRMGWAYRIGQWVWTPKDLMIVDEEGNEFNEFPLPDPVQFDAKTLFI